VLVNTYFTLNHFPSGPYIYTAGREQCRGGWPFINILPASCLCVLRGSTQDRDPLPAVSRGHSGTPIVVRDLCVRSRSCDH
ncbi:unnamed protein product, partial [Staurois parvus]